MEIVFDILAFFAGVLTVVVVVVITGTAIAAVLEAGIALGSLVVAGVERVRERLAAGSADGVPPAYSLSLLVRFDEQSGCFCPAVQLRGYGELKLPRIRLELVDRKGTIRLVRTKRLARISIGTELLLARFEPPGGARPAEVLGWHWDVVIEDKEGERARWREHPRPAGHLNAEAELV